MAAPDVPAAPVAPAAPAAPAAPVVPVDDVVTPEGNIDIDDVPLQVIPDEADDLVEEDDIDTPLDNKKVDGPKVWWSYLPLAGVAAGVVDKAQQKKEEKDKEKEEQQKKEDEEE
jgi:epidermal growth factor receptor substrate 15